MRKKVSGVAKGTAYILALSGLLIVLCFWQLAHLGGFQWGVDEGMHLMAVFLMQKGYLLYSDIWRDQLPGLAELILLGFTVFGNSVAVGRAVVTLSATLGLLGVALLSHELGGPVGSLVSVVIVAIAPNVFWLSRAVVSPDLPSISLATLSLALTFGWLRTGRRRWLALAGIVFAMGFLVKATATLVLIPLGLTILLSHQEEGRSDWAERARDLGLFALAVILPILIGLSRHDWRAMYDQVVVTQLRSSQVYDPKVASHARKIWRYLSVDNYGLLALGLYGIIPGLRTRWRETLVILSWLCVTIIALLVRSPMWPKHHLVVLLLPLGVLAGIACQQIWDHLRRISALTSRSQALLILGLIALGVYLTSLPGILRTNRDLLAAPTYESQELAVRYIEQTTAADDFIITDYPIIPFLAERRVPPSLCTVSGKRIKIGLLTAEELIAATEEYQPKAIISWIERLPRLPAFMDWLRGRYYLACTYGEDHRIYLAFEPSSIQNPQRASLDHKVELLGYTIDNPAVEAGSAFHLTLYLQAKQRMERIYKVFTHLLDREENMWGQKDEIAWGWFHPTTDWLPGEVIVQEFEIPVSIDAPPGAYIIEVGMYDSETGKRLPVFDENGERVPEKRILLGEVKVR